MARISPNIWKNEQFSLASTSARLVFIGLLIEADSRGKTLGHPALVRARIFPFDEIKIETVTAWMNELVEAGLIDMVRDGGSSVFYIRSWRKIQGKRRPDPLSKKLRGFIFSRDGGTCQLCGESIAGSFHVDHIVPVAHGGTDAESNLQVAHPLCNMRKGAQL